MRLMLKYFDKNLVENLKKSYNKSSVNKAERKDKNNVNRFLQSAKSCRLNVLIRKFNNKPNDDGAMSPSLPTLSWSRKRVSSGPAPC